MSIAYGPYIFWNSVLHHPWDLVLIRRLWCTKICGTTNVFHGPLTRYVKLRVAHAPGMPGTFSPPPTTKETANYLSRDASRHVTHVPWYMSGSLTRGGGENVIGIPGACTTRTYTYLREAHACVPASATSPACPSRMTIRFKFFKTFTHCLKFDKHTEAWTKFGPIKI